jgi:hypothetical protein
VNSSTSSVSDPTTTTSAPGVAEKPGDFFVDSIRDRGSNEYLQKRCAKCDRVTQQTTVDIEVFNEHGRAISVRVVICTECGNSVKQAHYHTQQMPNVLLDAKS